MDNKQIKQNTIGKISQEAGLWIIILGVIGSIALGIMFPTITTPEYYFQDTKETFNWFLAIVGVLSSAISGFFFITLGEIINLLQTIINNNIKE